MRALCASIITAGALVGLGLTGVGLGLRYQAIGMQDPGKLVYVKWVQLDTPMMLIIVVLLCALLVGLAALYVGLAYHHERRHHERHHAMASRVGE